MPTSAVTAASHGRSETGYAAKQPTTIDCAARTPGVRTVGIPFDTQQRPLRKWLPCWTSVLSTRRPTRAGDGSVFQVPSSRARKADAELP